MGLKYESKKWLANQSGCICNSCKNRSSRPVKPKYMSIYVYRCRFENAGTNMLGYITEDSDGRVLTCKKYESK